MEFGLGARRPLVIGVMVLLGLGVRASAQEGRSDPGSWLGGVQPLVFVANEGQWETPAHFVVLGDHLRARFEEGGVVLDLQRAGSADGPRRALVRIDVGDPLNPVKPAGADPKPARCHYFLGADPEQWRPNVPVFGAVLYRHLLPGIDLRFRDQGGVLEYDVLVAAGAAVQDLTFTCQGVEDLEVADDGSLLMHTAIGVLRQTPPRAWYELPQGRREVVACSFVRRDATRYAFELLGAPRSLPLVVDPGLRWSTFVGGSLYDQLRAVARDGGGDVVASGSADSPDFPTTPGVVGSTFGGGDADCSVIRVDSSGSTLLYATYIGGGGVDTSQGMTIGPAGDAIISGQTGSTDLPTTPLAYDTTFNSRVANATDCFVARLSASGSALIFLTYLGGAEFDESYEPSLDLAGNIYVPGLTHSENFPTTPGAYSTSHSGDADAFVSCFDPSGTTLLASTLLGGSRFESARGSGVLSTGDVVICGLTTSPDLPLVAPVQPLFGGVKDGFFARLDPSLSSLLVSTFLGGSMEEIAYDLAVGPGDTTTVVGFTDSPDLPVTPGAFDTTFNGLRDTMVLRLDAAGTSLVYGLYLGGSNFDLASTVVVDRGGSAIVGGASFSSDWPVTYGSYDPFFNSAAFNGSDGVVFRLKADGSKVLYSTYLGGSVVDWVNSLVLGEEGGVIAAGSTWSSDFPSTPGAYDPTFNDQVFPGNDGFLAALDLLPAGARPYGSATSPVTGGVVIGVEEAPLAGYPLTLTSTGGPPGAGGVLLLATAPAIPAENFLGVAVNVDFMSPWSQFGLATDGLGYAALTLALPPGSGGLRAYAQFAWINPAPSIPLSPPVWATRGLALTVQ